VTGRILAFTRCYYLIAHMIFTACLSHQFDHTLSNDIYGTDTVLYELAVFSGRMNIEDIQKMELHLMQKHGIVCQK